MGDHFYKNFSGVLNPDWTSGVSVLNLSDLPVPTPYYGRSVLPSESSIFEIILYFIVFGLIVERFIPRRRQQRQSNVSNGVLGAAMNAMGARAATSNIRHFWFDVSLITLCTVALVCFLCICCYCKLKRYNASTAPTITAPANSFLCTKREGEFHVLSKAPVVPGTKIPVTSVPCCC